MRSSALWLFLKTTNPFSLFGSLYDQECVSGFLPLTPLWASGPRQFVSLAEVGEFARAVIQQQVRAAAGRSPWCWEDHDALSTLLNLSQRQRVATRATGLILGTKWITVCPSGSLHPGDGASSSVMVLGQSCHATALLRAGNGPGCFELAWEIPSLQSIV